MGFGVRLYVSNATAPLPEEALYAVRYEMCQWLRKNIPEDRVLASWNAGQLGFFSGHRVVNLDGLVNSKEYYDSVLSGREPLSRYLNRSNVSYLVDYRDADTLTEGRRVVFSLPTEYRGTARLLRVWDLGVRPKSLDKRPVLC